MTTSLLWFRQDLRLEDNPALIAALADGAAVVPLFVWSDGEEYADLGGASRWWLHHSLAALEAALRQIGSRLIIRSGDPLTVLKEVVAASAATRVHWNRRYEPAGIAIDRAVKAQLRESGITVQSSNAALLHEPWTIANGEGKPYRVFTPFSRACRSATQPPRPLPALPRLNLPDAWPASLSLDALALLPSLPWDVGMRAEWQPGEAGARTAMAHFVDEHVSGYLEERDIPAHAGTSRLSPHLHWGELSIRTLWYELAELAASHPDEALRQSADGFQRQLLWREFAHHLLFHFPQTVDQPLREEFLRFPWVDDVEALRAWQRGRTGVPIIDAGMRQLWQTGWMHNRVRMLVGSFLVKDLRIAWQAGAKWFWETLVDADLANNTMGWQWVAGCGADAAPYFRVFNPVTQGERFDTDGAYVRRWVPELADLPSKWIHHPWDAPTDVLEQAHVQLGRNYPLPIVDHDIARREALAAFQSLKGERES